MVENDTPRPVSGPLTACVVAAGIGCFALGALTVASEASGSMHRLLEIVPTVGTLSGKALGAIIAWATSWGVLHGRWRARDLDSRRPILVAAILIALGLLGTFPPFFYLFG